MPVKINATGGGSVTVSAASTASDFTLTLPAVTDTVVGLAATQTLTNKTLTTPVIATINGGTSSSITLQSNGTNGLIVSTTQDLQFNSGFGSVATAYGCRAWVNFNGTGVVAIRGSGNVSSITDNGTGDYSINYTSAMPDASYAYSHAYSNEVNVVHGIGFLSSLTTGAIRIQHYNISNSNNTVDKGFVQIVVFR